MPSFNTILPFPQNHDERSGHDMNDTSFLNCCMPPPEIKPGELSQPQPYGNKYESLKVNDPSKPYIFHPHSGSGGCFPHWHENVEILFFYTDNAVFRDRERYEAKVGDLVVFNSNSLHAVPPDSGGCSYDCLIVDMKFCVENDINCAVLDFDAVIRDERAKELFLAAADEIVKPSDSFSAAARKARILDLLVYISRSFSRPAPQNADRSDTVRRAIGYINSRLDKPMSVDEIADHVKMSKYYFCREFRRETGYTVVRYINNVRAREAERLLKQTDAPVQEIARTCGYENLSYFTRTFKSVTGKTPSETRRDT